MSVLTEEQIFTAAVQKPLNERALFLDCSCAGDALLRSQIESLLQGHDRQDSLLDAPVVCPTNDAAPSITEGPGTRIGPYKLLQQIGEGGFGVVYMAEQQQPVRRKVALKIIKPGMDTKEVVARFESERQALALMDHANIAKIFDAGTTESGRPYFVMELVKGIPITKFCDENHVPPEDRLELFIKVCNALQHAHQKGIIHRDLKPSNVMVTMRDGCPVPKVIDFGVAKATSQTLTERTLFTAYGQMIGTPAYMSPEQAEMSCLDTDTRSDIYSLGVLLYELLTGTTPFDSRRLREAGFAEMQRIIRDEEPPKPSTRVSTLQGQALTTLSQQHGIDKRHLRQLMKGELDWIVMKSLDKDREQRYESASSLARDIRCYLSDEPVQACPPTAFYRFRKYARRNRVALATGGLVASALIGGIVISTWQSIRATRAEFRAEANATQAWTQEQKARAAEQKALAAAEAEAAQRRSAEEQARLLVEQRELSEINKRVDVLVLEEMLNVVRKGSTDESQRHQAIISAVSKLKTVDPQERATTYLRIGNLLVGAEQYAAARATYDAGLSLDPFDRRIYIGRGDLQYRQNAFEEAAADYTQAIKSPRSSGIDDIHVPYIRRGFTCCQRGQFDRALADFEQAHNLAPLPTLNALEMGFDGTYVTSTLPDPKLGEGILKLIDKTAEESRKSLNGRRDRASLLVQFGQLQRALDEYEGIITAEGTKSNDYYFGSVVAAALGDQAAYRRFSAAGLIQNGPNLSVFPPWYCSITSGAIDDYGPAIAIARSVITKYGTTSAAHQMALGSILYRAGEWEESQRILQAALKLKRLRHDSTLSADYAPYLLAMAEFRLGRTEEARKLLVEANDLTARILSQPGNWRRRLTLELMQKEATQLIDEAGRPDNTGTRSGGSRAAYSGAAKLEHQPSPNRGGG